MPYGPYNHVPKLINDAKKGAMNLVAPVVNEFKRQGQLAADNNPGPLTQAKGRTRNRPDIFPNTDLGGERDKFMRGAVGTAREIAPALKQGFNTAVDFTSWNIIEPAAGAIDTLTRYPTERIPGKSFGKFGTINNSPPSIADGYEPVDEGGKQIAVRRGPGLDPIFRGSVGRGGDAAEALRQGRGANAARQQTIDADASSLVRGRAKIQAEVDRLNGQGGSRFDQVVDRQLANIDKLQNGSFGTSEGQRLFRATQALGDLSGDLTSRENTGDRVSASRYASDAGVFRNEQDNVLLEDRNRIAQQRADDTARYQAAAQQARATNSGTEFMQGFGTELAEIASLNGIDSPEFDEAVNVMAAVAAATPYAGDFAAMVETLSGPQIENQFEGGLIEEYAQGGPILPQAIPGQPAGPDPAMMNKYQQYAVSAQEMGLTAVPFETFAGLQGASGKTIENFAEGGEVSAGGKMVIDSDPNAPIDSIPAEIDGERPAALNSGEFVIPTDVVLYYGTDKLNKMIEKARDTGEDTNGPAQSTAFQLGGAQQA